MQLVDLRKDLAQVHGDHARAVVLSDNIARLKWIGFLLLGGCVILGCAGFWLWYSRIQVHVDASVRRHRQSGEGGAAH